MLPKLTKQALHKVSDRQLCNHYLSHSLHGQNYVVVVVVEYLYSASRSASNALIVPQRCEEMCL